MSITSSACSASRRQPGPPAAILFPDLESSSPLARRLPTVAHFALGRRLACAADQCAVDAGGLVGRHAGDGVVAFFLAETAGPESAAARVEQKLWGLANGYNLVRLTMARAVARAGVPGGRIRYRHALPLIRGFCASAWRTARASSLDASNGCTTN
jgi:class 3 adenylate cyclase